MRKKYLKLNDTSIYAVYYSCNRVLYFNLDYNGTTKIFILIR